MTKLLVHLLVSALLLLLVSQIVTGIHIASFGYALLAALVLGIANFLVRPILIIVTLPITILTLGLFLIVINALMLMLTGAIVPGFHVASFGAALLGGLLLGLFNLAASAILNRSARPAPPR
ncbi:MAG TPA: phage holin family protein [Steroidobacteraceae bacterium]|jgi:putative membrane protein|nr:phage holin family protein [Steroidobacteraceae bacterium]